MPVEITLPQNSLYKTKEINRDFWNNLEVGFDKINDEWDLRTKALLNSGLRKMTVEELYELCDVFGKIRHGLDAKDDLVDVLINSEQAKILAYLREFQNQKKKSIDRVYEWIFEVSRDRYDKTHLGKLAHLFNYQASLLFDIYTCHKWLLRNTGSRYHTGISLNGTIIKFTAEIEVVKALVNGFYSRSQSHEYKLFSTAHKADDRLICLIHKQTADLIISDFEAPMRHKPVDELMFEIDVNSGIVEFKISTVVDKGSLNRYFSDNLNCALRPLLEMPYKEFSKSMLDQLLTTKTSIDAKSERDLIVSRVGFSSSALPGDPKVTLELPKGDIWPAVHRIHLSKVVDVRSLADIETMTLHYDGTTRMVKTVVLDNGDVLYNLQDGNLSAERLNAIKNAFCSRFGFPLNQPISNMTFDIGMADKVDYILSKLSPENLDDDLALLHKELVDVECMSIKEDSYYVCANPKCEKRYDTLPETGCLECGEEIVAEKRQKTYHLEKHGIKKLVLTVFRRWIDGRSESTLSQETKRKIFGTDYAFHYINTDALNFRVIVTTEIIPVRVLNIIGKQLLTPTIVVYAGFKESDVQSYQSSSIYAINFGQLYLCREKPLLTLDKVYEMLLIRTSGIVAQQATASHESLARLLETGDKHTVPDGYTDEEFEDDVFAIIKDIFPNSDKWGKEMSGQRVPEGLFCLQWNCLAGNQTDKHARVYSFDCKLTTQQKGYDLGTEEKRKSWDYVEELHKLRGITQYSNNQQISGHIFIANKFRERQISELREYFKTKMHPRFSTIPVFIELEQLILLHGLFRQKRDELVMQRRDALYEGLNELLLSNQGVLTTDNIYATFEEVLGEPLDYEFLEFKWVRDKLKRPKKTTA